MKRSAQYGQDREKGVSLLEVLVVVAIALIVSAAAIINVLSSLKLAAADSAAQLIQQEMRVARQDAISKRLVYRLTFNAPSGIVLDQLLSTTSYVSGVATTVTTITNVSNDSIPGQVSFQILSGTPQDQDGFCSCAVPPCTCPTQAVDFNAGTQIYFQPDGAGRDANGKLCNGVVYTAISGDMASQRSVTVWGSTGRITLYKLFNGPNGYYWK